jgi:hypothetical protein
MADYIRPTPRNPILGLLADAMMGGLAYMEDPRRTQQMRGLGGLLSDTGIAQTMERLSYGEPLTTGRGMTTRLRPEAEAALFTLGPEAVPIGRAATAATKAVGRGAMAAGRAGERYAERVVPQIMERGGLPAEMVSAMGQGTQSPLTVYHGSPYRFNRFDPAKIGSGEGAQAYGYGHYVAESPGVAAQYRKQLAPGFIRTVDDVAFDSSNPQHMAANYMEMFGKRGKSPKQIAQMLSEGGHNEAAQIVLRGDKLGQIGEQARGSLYTIDLPDEQIARMIDYDKPLIQQPKEIQQKLKAVVDQQLGAGTWDEWIKTNPDFRDLQNDLLENVSKEKVAELIRQQGIPGIRYLDQQSRPGTTVIDARLEKMLQKHGGDATAAVDEFMRGVYNTPKRKAEMRAEFLKELEAPRASNFVVFPGNEDLLRILEVDGGLLGR